MGAQAGGSPGCHSHPDGLGCRRHASNLPSWRPRPWPCSVWTASRHREAERGAPPASDARPAVASGPSGRGPPRHPSAAPRRSGGNGSGEAGHPETGRSWPRAGDPMRRPSPGPVGQNRRHGSNESGGERTCPAGQARVRCDTGGYAPPAGGERERHTLPSHRLRMASCILICQGFTPTLRANVKQTYVSTDARVPGRRASAT